MACCAKMVKSCWNGEEKRILKFSWIWAYNPIQEVLAEPGWRDRMTVDDWRALSPLIYHHVNPYGRIELDMSRRLAFAA